MLYRKLRRTWSYGTANHIPGFRDVFPELSNVKSSELCDRFIKLNMDFYYEEKSPVNPLIRLTLPFAILVLLTMLLSLPFYFIISGYWGYPLGNNNRILNWFKALGLK